MGSAQRTGDNISQRGEVSGAADGHKLRVAVVGSGPSGLYAVRSLLGSERPVGVDVFDQLPAPYGLVRYGVAPDNPKMRQVIRVLREPFAEGDVEFFGNVAFGEDLRREDLRAYYHAVIYATGTQGDRSMNIPGEDLPGSSSAREFVNWYCGHPDDAEREFPLHGPNVAVIGAGNVALDIARMLARSNAEIAATDVPDRVLAALHASQITDIYVLARRGPAQAKFTPPELREMGRLANADVIVHPDELVVDAQGEATIARDRQARKNVELLREWSQRKPEGKPRRVHLRFLHSPVRVLGEQQVTGLVAERNALTDDGQVTGTGEYQTVDVGLVLRAVGYQARPLPDVPFNPSSSTVPHRAGRVLDEGGEPMPGEYVTGWAKRGPSGVIGTNKSDAAETVHSLFEDVADFEDRAELTVPPRPERAQMIELLADRGVAFTDWAGWLRLDTHETDRGAAQGRPRAKIPDRVGMLDISRGRELTARPR